MWGEEESVNENFDVEPFYDPGNDPGIDLRKWFHLDSRWAVSTWRAMSDEKWKIADTLKYKTDDEEEIETIIVPGKRPHGSKLKKKIVYVYDSSDSDDDENKNLLSKPPAGMRLPVNMFKRSVASEHI